MPGHLLGVLEPSVVLQVNSDASCPPGVTSDRDEKTREASFADRFGVSRSTLYRNTAGPESPKMLMIYAQSSNQGLSPLWSVFLSQRCAKIPQVDDRNNR